MDNQNNPCIACYFDWKDFCSDEKRTICKEKMIQEGGMNVDETARAKAWCFDNGVSEKTVEKAWNNAITQGNFIIKNLALHGFTWTKLPPHLLKELVEEYR